MELINVALTLPRTRTEGPGIRFAIWVQGCPLRCPRCCNPEMLSTRRRHLVSVDELSRAALSSQAEGISLLGGEPFLQAEPLAALAATVQEAGQSVVTFTGYTLEELRAQEQPGVAELLRHTDLLVDGPYVHAQRSSKRRFIGSDNQRLIFLSERYQKDDPRFTMPNQIEIKIRDGEISVSGFPTDGLDDLVPKVDP